MDEIILNPPVSGFSDWLMETWYIFIFLAAFAMAFPAVRTMFRVIFEPWKMRSLVDSKDAEFRKCMREINEKLDKAIRGQEAIEKIMREYRGRWESERERTKEILNRLEEKTDANTEAMETFNTWRQSVGERLARAEVMLDRNGRRSRRRSGLEEQD